MIIPRELVNTVFAEPFQPFRINMASGKSYDIRHPEVIQVGKSHFTIYTQVVEGEEGDCEYAWKKVSLMLVESIEPLDAKTPAGSR